MAIKKIPMRKCLGCMEQKPKKELVRVVKSADGDISLDLTGKKNGRGAYICPEVSCLEKAKKAKEDLAKEDTSKWGDKEWKKWQQQQVNSGVI